MKRRTFVQGCAAGAVTLVTPFGIVRAFPQDAETDLAESFRNASRLRRPVHRWTTGTAQQKGAGRSEVSG